MMLPKPSAVPIGDRRGCRLVVERGRSGYSRHCRRRSQRHRRGQVRRVDDAERPPVPARSGARRDGSVWYTAQLSNAVGHLDPATGRFREYSLPTPDSGPHGLLEDPDGNIWYTGNAAGLIGKIEREDRQGDRVQDAGSESARSAQPRVFAKRTHHLYRAGRRLRRDARSAARERFRSFRSRAVRHRTASR